jgi:hypothetical protein
MIVLWGAAGILVVLAGLGYLSLRQRKKQEIVSWTPSSEQYHRTGDAESRYPRPQYGSFPYAGGGGGDASGDGA